MHYKNAICFLAAMQILLGHALLKCHGGKVRKGKSEGKSEEWGKEWDTFFERCSNLLLGNQQLG
jgi:hypothetical protein